MFCVRLKKSGHYVTYFDCDGMTASPNKEDAIWFDCDVGCMALIMLLVISCDFSFEDFHIQYFPVD